MVESIKRACDYFSQAFFLGGFSRRASLFSPICAIRHWTLDQNLYRHKKPCQNRKNDYQQYAYEFDFEKCISIHICLLTP
jgi:hypothetical protein